VTDIPAADRRSPGRIITLIGLILRGTGKEGVRPAERDTRGENPMVQQTCIALAVMLAAAAGARGAGPPASEAPAENVPASEAPAKDAPAKEAPAEDAPGSEAPASEAPASEVPAEETDPLKEVYSRAPLVVEFQVDTVQANPTVDARLVWEARAALLEVLKGKLLAGEISVHVDSVVRVFDTPRAEVEGKRFVAPLKPLGQAARRRFQVIGRRVWPTDSRQADRLRKLADTQVATGTGGGTLRLTVEPVEKVFPVHGAKTVEVRLTNTGKDSATYIQAPIVEKGGKLYLPGKGRIKIRRTTGEAVPDKGNVATGMVPPPPPEPALILPGAAYVETVDLDKYYTLPAGRYTLAMFLATPDGQGRITSNGFSFQVGAVDLPETPETTTADREPTVPEATETPTETPAETTPRGAAGEAPGETASAEDLPHPHAYTPGEPSFGLAALLRPTRSVYPLGQPVTVQLRLINAGPRTVAIDTRLERTLTVTVQAVNGSPQPLMVRQVIPWPDDEAGPPSERAYLRKDAFWGRTLNLNTLFGKQLDAIEAPTPAELADAKSLRYERFGRNLFGFPEPGTYRISATYAVKRSGKDGQGKADSANRWWTGKVQTNPITIRIAEKKPR